MILSCVGGRDDEGWRNVLLYPVELRAHGWRARRDSNPQPGSLQLCSSAGIRRGLLSHFVHLVRAVGGPAVMTTRLTKHLRLAPRKVCLAHLLYP